MNLLFVARRTVERWLGRTTSRKSQIFFYRIAENHEVLPENYTVIFVRSARLPERRITEIADERPHRSLLVTSRILHLWTIGAARGSHSVCRL